ncbi:sugar phosphate isomerase/epimerase family protein [Metabacillus litoralis]|uniref:sugar phosphate isomerase/epimerase family protein n=1 Tax=Metabacillus litoralis TaxID=152268 RepID=UPI001CFF2D50|nr:TIM barrel protein [Metabacillus litoralis]
MKKLRLAGPVFIEEMNPESWIEAVKKEGYRAAVCPIDHTASHDEIERYRMIADKNDIMIAEVGAWSNPISSNKEERKAALDYCKKQLDLAEKIGAKCCVNIAGSRGLQWDGPHHDNFSDETFSMIVDSVREIIDEVNPTRTHFTLETLPWIFPDSADSYLSLIKAIDRKGLAVHLDPVNMISNPRLFFHNGEMIRDAFKKLGPFIKCCHAKDITMSNEFMVHLDEVRPGKGSLNYQVLLTELNRLDIDTPIILEHLPSQEEYRLAAAYVREKAAELNISL